MTSLAAAGMELFHHYSEINTIGLSEGLGKINILSAYRKMKSELRSGRHAVFVPVDFPDVNLRLCKIARGAGVPYATTSALKSGRGDPEEYGRLPRE